MSDHATPMTVKTLLEKYATVPAEVQNRLPKRQRIYPLFRYFTKDRSAGFAIKLKFCPDYDPALQFEEETIVLPEDFMLPQRKNIVIQIDLWDKHNKRKSSQNESTHFIYLTDIDRLLRLLPAVSANKMFEFYLEEKGFSDVTHVSEEVLRGVVDYAFGKDAYQNVEELPELFVAAWRNQFMDRTQNFFSHGTKKKLPKAAYELWMSVFSASYIPRLPDGQVPRFPWKIGCVSVPWKNTYGKDEFGEYELTQKYDASHMSEVKIRISSATFAKALFALQEGLERWFDGSLIEQSGQK